MVNYNFDTFYFTVHMLAYGRRVRGVDPTPMTHGTMALKHAREHRAFQLSKAAPSGLFIQTCDVAPPTSAVDDVR